jgi:hypothetical protein
MSPKVAIAVCCIESRRKKKKKKKKKKSCGKKQLKRILVLSVPLFQQMKMAKLAKRVQIAKFLAQVLRVS